MIDFNDIATTIAEATSGTFVGITNYISQKGDISSVTGHIGVSYAGAKAKGIRLLEEALEADDFEEISIKGECYYDDKKQEYNARKRSCALKAYDITFSKEDVVEQAKLILEAWKAPAKKTSNKTQFTEKENGFYLEEETGNYNFMLLVAHQTYKGSVGEKKKTVSAPITVLKGVVRKRFEQKLKAFTIGKDKFDKLTINKHVYVDGEITF